MRADLHRTRGGGLAEAATGTVAVPGRTEVKERVYRTVTARASAALIGVPHGDVQVEVLQHRSGLTVRIATPIPVPHLADTEAIAGGASILDRARQLQEDLQVRLATMLGRDITRVHLAITGATTPKRRRVR
ncbi:hypothetical protein MUN76_10100 [Leucobacter rhizosphaerae]|uniref:NTP pyrophosphohydrolase n=1 Tax=Leucobacter rhizosphaerae TaxID=2932245 RepID=A0ABY4FSX5_9MICO|nr:hypothetical protein [Leucobacter rhizosphaerae]UOQ59405.1 hypothetical protein MUN76_10100 [Leucobacter rhizosphaerae]